MTGWLDKILAALVLALLLAAGVLLLLNANLRADLAKAQGDAAALLRVNADFKSAAAAQNAQIAVLHQQALARQQRLEVAMRQAKRHAAMYIAQANSLEKIKTGADDCAAAREIWRDYKNSTLKNDLAP